MSIGLSDKRLGRYLGIAFLIVFAGSAASAALSQGLEADTTAETLRNIADHPAQMQWSTMIELCITSVGIIVLAVLLYAAVRRQNPLVALVALGWWIAESITLAVSTVGAFLLVSTSEAFVEAESATQLALGDTLLSLDLHAWEIHMLFFGLGGILWYTLMFQGKIVPRWLSAFGIIAVALALGSTVATLAADVDVFYLGYPTGVFELVMGVWLITKGLTRPAPDSTDVEQRELAMV